MRKLWFPFALILIAVGVAAFLLFRGRKTSEEGEPKLSPDTAASTQPDENPATPPGTQDTAQKPSEEPKKTEPVDADAALREADAQIAAGKPLAAQKLLTDALARDPKLQKPDEFKTRLTKLGEEIFFSSKAFPPLSITCDVVSGDALARIAAKHRTTIELIRRINALKSDTLRPGQRLKVVPGGFDVVVDKSQFLLTVYKNGIWVREFKVGLGKDGSTPVGTFLAGHKLREPVYFGEGNPIPFSDRKNNPLGTRWITIQDQYGIHGTWEPDSMGKEQSKGCVRMLNEDVEWLFDLVVPGMSKVAIKP